ncbi:MAG: transglycosylase domain-containing protein [Solirubrobacterales bacterium]|nr:transglycosylase domain-containing protein [Solirubrobacterales bacterium]
MTGIAAGGGWVLSIAAKAPDPDSLKEINKGQNSVIYAGDGSKLGMIDSDEVRTPIPLSDIPKDLQNATIAIEDERFYSHNGIDIQGGLRALVKNLESGGITEGASTITMQLMRNLFITNPKRDYERKIIEAKMALDYEKDHSKAQILEKYLNTAPYGTNEGRTAIGVSAAAKVYFSRKPENLNLPQVALLAGLPQAPTDYNPIQNPRGATARRNEVLDSMARLGYITEARAAQAKKTGLQLDPATDLFAREDPFFFDYVESELIKKYGVATVRRGGLKVYTTVQPSMQEAGLSALDSNLYSGGPSGALVSINPKNGDIEAMVSSTSYSDNQYNLAAQGKRQPGSTFKVFTLATAIHEGIDPYTTYYVSKPLNINDPVYGPWEVHTYGDSYSGTISVAEATLKSDNSVYAQLALDVGPDKVADMAHALGITTKLDGYPAETLGGLTIGVSPLEMAGAYSTIASGGVRHDPTAIEKVVFPDGKVDRPGRSKPKRVLSEAEAYEITKILHQNVLSGTGTNANTGCGGQAGKTGTTDNQIDAWFVGYQPNLATAVWYGYPESNDISTGSDGGDVPAGIWRTFYTNAAIPCEETPVPSETMQWGDFSGGYTVSPGTKSDYGPDADDSTDTGTDDGTDDSTDTGTGTEEPNGAYAPGLGQDPAGGGGGTGGGGTGGGGTPSTGGVATG